MKVLSSVALLLGVWIMLSPAILDYPSFDATASHVIIGAIVTLVAGVRLSLPQVYWPSWVGVVLSVQLIIIPLNTAAAGGIIHWNATLAGLVLLAISLRSASKHRLFPQSALQ